MDLKKTKKLMAYMAALYWGCALVIFLISADAFRMAPVQSSTLSPSIVIGEIVDGMELTQQMTIPMDRLDTIEAYAATYGRENTGTLVLTVTDQDGTVLAVSRKDVSTMADNSFTAMGLNRPVDGRAGETVTLTFHTEGCTPGNAITLFGGNSVSTTRVNVEKSISEEDRYRVNGEIGVGCLCVQAVGVDYLIVYYIYWPIIAAAFAVIAFYVLRSYRAMKRGENSLFAAFSIMMTRYKFLIKQLVGRDFKAKYKRSVLGVAWSFLNPLMTMLVQYVVFSTLFKSSVPNFPVYLLTGTVFFSFFNEAVSMGMSSIIGNASLIKKVYVPKYIYPISRVLSSLVNFAMAFLPLLLVMLITRTALRPSLLLLVFDVLCFLCFITGMVMILSTAVVFFQDVQFLWGVASMLWMYVTPIFYPESIIPARLLPLYHLNPLYQYINFARTCIIYGISPHPTAYLGCLLPAVIMLVLGAWVFKKQQDKFIMYV